MRALVTGATGFVGPHLLALLDHPVVLSRNAESAKKSLTKFNVTVFSWNPTAEEPPREAFDGIDTVFHLAGDPVAGGRWTEEKKRKIRDSRTLGTRNLVQALKKLDQKPKVLVSASAVGWYGSRGDEVLDESSSPAHDFLADVCVEWEREAEKAAELGIRVASIRTGIALGRDGGALVKMETPFKFGVGGPLGNGKQWMPWIHVDDLARMYVYAAEHAEASGPLNGSAPHPVTNREFTKALASALHRPAFLPAPYFALRVAMGEFAKVMFASQRVVPKKPLAVGFEFKYPEITAAMNAIYGS
jgi:uncharacterized protein (TIGR01777 family)